MSKLVCTECNNSFSIPRKNSKRRKEGHIKHLTCFKCNKITKHIEDNRSKQEIEWDNFQEQLLNNAKDKKK